MTTPTKPDHGTDAFEAAAERASNECTEASHSSVLRSFIYGARWAREWTLANDPTVRALVEALELRKMHDDDCADATEKFKPHEMCECGASTAREALAAWKERVK